MIGERSGREAAFLYGVAVLFFGGLAVSAPIPVLLDRFVPDDAFYYFQTAREFATTGRSSFDGLHQTNGYQPLWFLLSIPVFIAFPEGGELPFRAMLLLQLLLAAGGAALMAGAIAQRTSVVATILTGIVWVAVFQRPASVNGLETGLQTFCFAMLFSRFLEYQHTDAHDERQRQALGLGVIGALLFLARIDSVLVLAPLGVWFLRQPRRVGRIPDWWLFAAPIGVVVAAYVGLNILTTGHPTPISGAAKVFHSNVSRDAAIRAGAGPLSVYVLNVLWPLLDRAWWIAASLAAPLVASVLAAICRVSPDARRLPSVWPFALGVWITFLFYGLVFHGGFSRTLWYYGPLVMTGWYYLALIGDTLARAPVLRSVPLVGPMVAGAAPVHVAGWGILVAIAAAMMLAALRRRLTIGLATPLAAAATLSVGALLAAFMAVDGLSRQEWIVLTTVSVALSGLLAADRLSRWAVAFVTLGLAVPFFVTHTENLLPDLRARPSNWNYHLYQGAHWARQSLPPNATIWGGSAGILGYFSGRRVVNTDGLANDWSFLDDVLRAPTQPFGHYIAQWDYAIDAMADESLAEYFPEGCFIPLPAQVVPPPFADGATTRQLRVFQMRSQGVADCRALRQD